jgi:hypothetical protein
VQVKRVYKTLKVGQLNAGPSAHFVNAIQIFFYF